MSGAPRGSRRARCPSHLHILPNLRGLLRPRSRGAGQPRDANPARHGRIPVTKGYACVKGIRFDQVQHAPDRVAAPAEARRATSWLPTTWDDRRSTRSVERLRAIIDEHGPQSVGLLHRQPLRVQHHDSHLLERARDVPSARRRCSPSAPSTATNKFRVSHEMYGSPFTLTFPRHREHEVS